MMIIAGELPMSTVIEYPDSADTKLQSESGTWTGEQTPDAMQSLPAAITRAASRHTHTTIRFLVDRDRIRAAYRAYAYFRWLDDSIDANRMTQSDRIAFVARQQALLARCDQGADAQATSAEEQMLVDLLRGKRDNAEGLRTYLHNMMAVMAFDAERRGRLISQDELTRYSFLLASAVTEAMHTFIGHRQPAPYTPERYLAVTAAHITNMLSDTCDDLSSGYFNIPREFLDAHHLDPADVDSDAYALWVRERVQLARRYFETGKRYLAQVPCLRCRVAGFAYAARFERTLAAIEADGYRLRPAYSERASLRAGLGMGWTALSSALRYVSV